MFLRVGVLMFDVFMRCVVFCFRSLTHGPILTLVFDLFFQRRNIQLILPRRSSSRTGDRTVLKDRVYYIALIDTLQVYDVGKVAERVMKVGCVACVACVGLCCLC